MRSGRLGHICVYCTDILSRVKRPPVRGPRATAFGQSSMIGPAHYFTLPASNQPLSNQPI